MTDQIPADLADKVRKIAAEMRDAMRREDDGYPYAEFLSDMGDYIKDLEALLPDQPRPSMAEMTEEERAERRWMQCDAGPYGRRGLIVKVKYWSVYVVDKETGTYSDYTPDLVTARPDLPRMEWPGTEKPAPAPALPDGWRLADHKDHGRVVVTNSTPESDGYSYCIFSSDMDSAGFDWYPCAPDALTYIDQEADTSDTVQPNTLAEGSVWEDADALTRACEETGRDQIVVADKRGSVGVWDTVMQCWRVSAPHADFAPYTVIRAGKKADQ